MVITLPYWRQRVVSTRASQRNFILSSKQYAQVARLNFIAGNDGQDGKWMATRQADSQATKPASSRTTPHGECAASFVRSKDSMSWQNVHNPVQFGRLVHQASPASPCFKIA